jgi:FkbM family methyltransferase
MLFQLIKILKKQYLLWFKSTTNTSPMEVEKHEQTFYIDYLSEGMTVFDVGANIGELCLLFSRFVGNKGRVHAFEASSLMFNKLDTMCQLVKRPQIIINHLAVTDKEGLVKLHVYDDEHSGWNSLADRPLEKYGINIQPTHIEEVEAITIDRYCEKNNILQIDLLKIDVEGAEYQVLLGAKEMFEKQKIRCCVFEFGQTTFDMGNKPQQIEDYFKHFGYQIRNVVKGDLIFPGRYSDSDARFSIHVAIPKI